MLTGTATLLPLCRPPWMLQGPTQVPTSAPKGSAPGHWERGCQGAKAEAPSGSCSFSGAAHARRLVHAGLTALSPASFWGASEGCYLAASGDEPRAEETGCRRGFLPCTSFLCPQLQVPKAPLHGCILTTGVQLIPSCSPLSGRTVTLSHTRTHIHTFLFIQAIFLGEDVHA